MATPSALDAARNLHRAGELEKAEDAYRRILASDPRHAEARHLLGVLACQRGDPARGAALIGEAIALNASQAQYHANLAIALQNLGRTSEALGALERAHLLAPEDTAIAYNLGAILQACGRHGDAIGYYRRALGTGPGHADALSNLGLALAETGRAAEALAPLHRAVELAPDHPTALTNLGMALAMVGAPTAGEHYLRQACERAPDNALALYNLAKVLQDLGRNAEAVAIYRRAAAANPRDVSTHYNLGNALRELGQVEDALAAYRQALMIEPRHGKAWRNRLSTLLYSSTVDAARRFADHRALHAAYATAARPAAPRPRADANRRLRIGYLSSDFRQHPVTRNMEPVLAQHDSAGFGVFAYADVAQPDAATERLRGYVERWRDIRGLADDQVAARIKEDGIDILVILAGRFDDNRPLVALHRAAPVQISLHDPATSGLAGIDYLIADRHLVPRDLRERFAERVLRLPSFYVHAPLDGAGGTTGGERRGAGRLTFASYCHPVKLSPTVLALWGRILGQLPQARLQLVHRRRYADPVVQDRIRAALREAGAQASQVDFLGDDVSRQDHLSRYETVDIALDPFPFTGSTSTFEALWMGVPVVTLAGDAMVERWSTSMLRAAGLHDCVAQSADDYVEIALRLARDGETRWRLRQSLRRRLIASPLCDGRRRARQMERLYRAVWRRWCARTAASGAGS